MHSLHFSPITGRGGIQVGSGFPHSGPSFGQRSSIPTPMSILLLDGGISAPSEESFCEGSSLPSGPPLGGLSSLPGFSPTTTRGASHVMGDTVAGGEKFQTLSGSIAVVEAGFPPFFPSVTFTGSLGCGGALLPSRGSSLGEVCSSFPLLFFLPHFPPAGGIGGQKGPPVRCLEGRPFSLQTGHVALFGHSDIWCPSSPHLKQHLLLSMRLGHPQLVCPPHRHL